MASKAPASPVEGRTTYDPRVMQRYADRLYTRARSIVVTYAFLGGLIGALLITIASDVLGIAVAWWIGAGMLAALGLVIGVEKAFALKLQAQTMLCQLQIEINTRSAPDGVQV